MQTIGQKIRELRVQRGMTQIELANGLVTPSMISLIETDKANPSPKLLQHIAEKLGVPMDYFLDDHFLPWESLGYFYLAHALLLTGSYEQASRLLQQLKGTATSLSSRNIQLLLATGHLYMGKYDEAIALFKQVLEEQTIPYDRQLQFHCFYMMGQAYAEQRNYTLAKHYWNKAFELIVRTDQIDPFAIRRLLLSSARLALQMGETEEAKEWMERAREFRNEGTSLQEIARSFVEKAQKDMEQKDYKIATDYSHRAVGLLQGMQLIKETIDMRVLEAILQGEKGNVKGALNELMKCKYAYTSFGIDTEQSFLHRQCARLYLRADERGQALFHAEKAEEAAKNEQDRAYAWQIRALILHQMGKTNQAISYLKKAIHLFEKNHMYDDLTRSYSFLSDMFSTFKEQNKHRSPR